MKKTQLYTLVFGLIVCAAAATSAADKDTAMHERRVEKTVNYLNRDAGRLDDKKAVTAKMKDDFKVNDARIKSLRDQKLGYGEITAVLAVAKEMPGGINDDMLLPRVGAGQSPARRRLPMLIAAAAVLVAVLAALAILPRSGDSHPTATTQTATPTTVAFQAPRLMPWHPTMPPAKR